MGMRFTVLLDDHILWEHIFKSKLNNKETMLKEEIKKQNTECSQISVWLRIHEKKGESTGQKRLVKLDYREVLARMRDLTFLR